MSSSILSTSYITQFVESYKTSQQTKQVTPLTDRKTKYQNLSNAWSAMQTKMNALKTSLTTLKDSDTTGVYNTKSASSSNTSFVDVTASSSATAGGYSIRVNQLAKSDLLVSKTATSSTAITSMAGTHKISVQSGDLNGTVSVDLTGSETYETILTKIANAANSDKGEAFSGVKAATDTYAGGSGTFKINLNGTEKSIDYDYSAGTSYGDIMNDLSAKINKLSGVVSEVVNDSGNVKLKISVNDNSQYISVKQSDDTGNLLSSGNLNMDVVKTQSVAGLMTTSVFAPSTGTDKISFSAKNSGLDYKLKLSDASGSALSFLGLDSTILNNHTLVASDTDAGFIYGESQLNAKVNFNGINVQRNSNIFSDLAPGVSISLKGVMSSTDQDVSVSVAHNNDKVKNAIKDFITKFNDTYSYIKARSTSDKSGRGLFVGDANASAVESMLRTAVMNNVPGIPEGNLSYLGQIGIGFDSTAGLSITDDSKLSLAVQDKPDQVKAMFTSSSGIATKLYGQVYSFLQSDGALSRITTSYSNSISSLTDKITAKNNQIDKNAEALRSRYEKLQSQLASLYQASSQIGSGWQ